jgi:ribosomal protein S14
MRIAGREYVTGQDRNEKAVVAHLYKGRFSNVGNPMCVRGWNRMEGSGYSIFRNLPDIRICKICLRRANAKLPGVKAIERKTKWL